MKKKILLSSIATIALCLCIIAGSTFALFTNSAKVDVAVTSGNVAVTAAIDANSFAGTSRGVAAAKSGGVVTFANGGTATLAADGSQLTIERLTPGDFVSLTVDGTNSSNVAVKYRYVIKCTEDNGGLRQYLTVKVADALCDPVDDDGDGVYDYFASAWTLVPYNATPTDFANSAVISIGMLDTVGNDAMNITDTTVFTVVLEAIQGNATDDEGNTAFPSDKFVDTDNNG